MLIEKAENALDTAAARIAIDNIGSSLQVESMQKLKIILYRTLARAEQYTPASAQGAFIGTGAEFTAFQAVAKVLQLAKEDVLIVDPYLSEKVLFDFVPTAAENVSIRLLADGQARELNTALRGGVERWQKQYGQTRPLVVRCTTPRLLHDRIIVIDNTTAYLLTQSLKDLAARSPATLMRADEDIAVAKIEAYATLWTDAKPL